jgi:L-ribulose-5-phosphate 4-epimerase
MARGRLAAALRKRVFRANKELAESGLVMGTFGNVSEVDRAAGLFVIKPSGVPYEEQTPDHMVPVSLKTGEVMDSRLRPSSDTPTHLELYRAFACGGIVHTHSEVATSFAQARLPVRCMGTTHADHFRGDVPVTRPLTREEVDGEYERNTGLVIVECFRSAGISPEEVPAVLVASHGPFTWGATALEAVEHARVLEYLARMEERIRLLAPGAPPPDAFLVDRHYKRKHGKGSYYGQR